MKRTEVRKRTLLVAINTAWLMQEFLNNDEYLDLFKITQSTMAVNSYIADLAIELYLFEQHFEYGFDIVHFDDLVFDIVRIVHSYARKYARLLPVREAIFHALEKQHPETAVAALVATRKEEKDGAE